MEVAGAVAGFVGGMVVELVGAAAAVAAAVAAEGELGRGGESDIGIADEKNPVYRPFGDEG